MGSRRGHRYVCGGEHAPVHTGCGSAIVLCSVDSCCAGRHHHSLLLTTPCSAWAAVWCSQIVRLQRTTDSACIRRLSSLQEVTHIAMLGEGQTVLRVVEGTYNRPVAKKAVNCRTKGMSQTKLRRMRIDTDKRGVEKHNILLRGEVRTSAGSTLQKHLGRSEST